MHLAQREDHGMDTQLRLGKDRQVIGRDALSLAEPAPADPELTRNHGADKIIGAGKDIGWLNGDWAHELS
jgi:hypothetical protein